MSRGKSWPKSPFFDRPYVRPAHIDGIDGWDEGQREEIEAQILAPKAPSRWIPVGPGASPLAWLPSRAYYEWHWHRGIDPDKRRIGLSPWLRQLIKERDEMVCGICGYFVPEDDCHIDHILPVARGGGDHPDNLRVTHSRCNMRKGAKV